MITFKILGLLLAKPAETAAPTLPEYLWKLSSSPRETALELVVKWRPTSPSVPAPASLQTVEEIEFMLGPANQKIKAS